jgi:hypothetical protein
MFILVGGLPAQEDQNALSLTAAFRGFIPLV